MENSVSEIYIFACQHRVPDAWRPPYSPEDVQGNKVRLIRLPCSAKLSTAHMLRPFETGIDGVLVMTCPENGCRSLEGSTRAKSRAREANNVLDEVGLGRGRVTIRQARGTDEAPFVEAITALVARTKQLGPNPVKGK
jgi:coenzyme F420-reducing hydrogenase delta subunit